MVEGQIYTIQYVVGASQFQYHYPYYLWEFSDLVVSWANTASGIGSTSTPLKLDTDYTLTGTQDQFGCYPDGVTVNLILSSPTAPPAGNLLNITRYTQRTQMNTWIDNNPFPADQEEHSFDKLTLMIQEISSYFLGFLPQPPSTEVPQGTWFIQYPIVPGTWFGWVMTTNGWRQFAPVSF